ncbi:hypothetical protein [Geminocystis sp. NIES-3709]|uniref:hypothetical protein n=1 Tax=Geminocystis sp. NIES-3709 TaxID=1617448 RepID=UPI0005FCC60E|nr:hypothetical protein [Geminocystis sp. NIES-3709]BAQ64768.1 hypothetical protein GM3709_1533 [Geminocystis sp. NIES-3709]
MNLKNLQYFTTIGLGLFLSASVKPVDAFSLNNNTESPSSSTTLISQLEGHDTYNGGEQMEWSDYSLGRVIGKSGGILFIQTEEGVVFHSEGGFCPGSDVLVQKTEDGRYRLVQTGHPQWISRLKAKYGWKQVASTGSLNERTAAIWAEMEKSSTTTREIPPREVMAPTNTYTPEPQVEQYNQPVRGLW